MASTDWYVKRRHYDGGESVLSIHDSESEANRIARRFNDAYQSDTFYAEKVRD